MPDTQPPPTLDEAVATDETVVEAWCAIETSPLPASLRARLEQDADAFLNPPSTIEDDAPEPLRLPWVTATGWLAAAAAVVVATTLWLNRPAAGPVAPTMAMLLEDADTVTSTLAVSNGDFAEASAEAIWNDGEQTGFLRLSNLPPAPEGEVYQIWVVDADRPDEAGVNRVDGGLFVMPEDGAATVAIDPKLPVGRAVGFAITREPAGGSVVSALGDRLILIGGVG